MITPISLESDITVVTRQLELVRSVQAQRFHVDIIDGLYADNITVVPADLQALDFSNVALDLHLLVNDPVEWVEDCVAIKPSRLYAQIERMGNIERYLDIVKGYGGVEAGLGIGLYTPITSLSDTVLRQADFILLMAIEPGFGGTPFHPEVIEKIKALRARWDGHIVIDGGMNPETYKQVLVAGASEAGANSALWLRGDFADNFSKFRE